jgi:steroid delta-isomerase-like uncharacterized protein
MAMTREQIAALFHRREADWRNRDAAALAADHAPTGVVVSPTGGVLEGRPAIERIYRLWFTAFPDLAITNYELVIDGDRVVRLADISGTHAGEFFGLPATGRRVQAPSAFVYALKDGQIEHERRILDFTGVLVQVGVLKAKPAAGV